MKTAVRYYSRSGNTRHVAEVIAKTAGTEAVSVDAENASLTEPVDLLFIGGALYAYNLDKNLTAYLESIPAENVKKAIVFSTSWISKKALDLISKALQAKGIPVEPDTLYFKSKAVKSCDEEVESFVKKHLAE